MRLKLVWLPGRFAVCRLPADAPVPVWADLDAACSSSPKPNAQGQMPSSFQPTAKSQQPTASQSLLSISRTGQELSIITCEEQVGDDVTAERGFVALQVAGPIAFSVVGVLASLTAALRDAEVPVLAVSTYDTDILLVRERDAERACDALSVVADVEPRSM